MKGNKGRKQRIGGRKKEIKKAKNDLVNRKEKSWMNRKMDGKTDAEMFH